VILYHLWENSVLGHAALQESCSH